MNRRLLDPYKTVELPEVIEEYLDHGATKCIAFNHRGTLMAAGCADGTMVIWDVETRGVAMTYKDHSMAITSIAWARNGRHLVSGALDETAVLWNVETNSRQARVELTAAVTKVSIDERDASACVVSLAAGLPVLVDFNAARYQVLPGVALEGEPSRAKASAGAAPAAPPPPATAVAVFGKCGRIIWVGQPKGILVAIERDSLRFLDVIKVGGSGRVQDMVINRKGTLMLVNGGDRVIRLYELPVAGGTFRSFSGKEVAAAVASGALQKAGSALRSAEPLLRPVREFQNAVEKLMWRAVTFTNDSEYVVAASAAKAQHIVYIWSRMLGKLECVLEGPKESVEDVRWHPTRSVLATVSDNGRIYLWARVCRENWSAFAPDFEELDENKEYIEREDEFDVNPRGEAAAATATAAATGEGDEDVDIMGGGEARALSSDDEDDDAALHYLPVTVVPVAPEEEPKAEEKPPGHEPPEEEDEAMRDDGASKLMYRGVHSSEGLPPKQIIAEEEMQGPEDSGPSSKRLRR